MSPNIVRNPHGRRKQEIPANLVQKWQSSPLRVSKPQVRRPKTACERCRTAKVRCHGNGQNECSRCTSRGLPCRYGQLDSSPGTTVILGGSDPDRRATPDEIQVDSDFDVDQMHEHALGDGVSFHRMLGESTAWPPTEHPAETLQQQEPQYTNWSSVVTSSTLDLPGAFQGAPPPAFESQPFLESLGLFPLITSTTANSLSWEDQLASQSCQCRAGLAQLIPNARAALQDRQLGGLFRVTSDVIRRCGDIVDCGACSVNCTELVCIMAIFQEVDGCFEYVAKGDVDGSIKVSMGLYEVEIEVGDQDAQEWRSMLVRQLVRRGDRLLDSISATCQGMLRRLDPGCRLGRVNIEYLEAVIGNSRENLHRTIEALEKAREAGQES